MENPKPTTTELTPEKFTGIKIGKRKKGAVGMPAVVAGTGHILKYMNPLDGVKTMLAINQKGGFDCPGCAWPDPDDDRSALGEYCENGMKAIAEEATNRRITADFFQKNNIEQLGKLSDFELGKLGRLTQPMLLREGTTHYESTTWDTALQLVADQLKALPHPDEAVFYTSGRTSNEAAFLYQLMIRMFGTNNLPDCSNMCHESSGKGLSETIGIGKGTVTLEDLHHSELILIIGQNPGTNHPRMLSALEKCKANGGKIVAINPLPEAGLLHFTNPQSVGKILTGGTPLADQFLQVKINGDVALLKAIEFCLWEKEQHDPGSVFDLNFIAAQTVGFQEFLTDLKSQNFEKLVSESGVSAAEIRACADLIASRKKMIICWAMGLTQHKNAVDNVRETVNLLLLRGSIGIPGAGACPVRGHSNVQGDRTMGIWEIAKPEFMDKLKSVFNFEPPREHGYDTVHAIRAMHEGKVGVFFAMGGNFLSATPDTSFTAEALRRCGLTVHVSTKLNRSHLVHGRQALILPCLGRTEIDAQAGGEQFVSVENSMGVVSSSRGILKPSSKDLRSEVAIVCGLAEKLLKNRHPLDWQNLSENYDHIRDLIEKVIPGFENFNERVRRPEGFYLPNGPREQRFTTADGKAHFSVNEASEIELKTDEFLMMTIRSHDQFNTTIYGLNDRYRGIYNERRVILMNEKDMVAANFRPNDVVNLTSEYRGQIREARKFLVIPFDIPHRCVATYFPEANTLIPVDEFARKSHTPVSKSIVIKIHRQQ